MTEDTPRYMTEQEVADLVKRSLSSLRNDRHLRRGLPYTKYGKSVRYRLSDVLDFMEARRCDPYEPIDRGRKGFREVRNAGGQK